MSDSGAEGINCPPQGSHHLETTATFTPAASLDQATMKFLAITLALAIFAGSPANVFSEEADSRLTQLKQRLNEYYRNISRPFEEQGEMVRNMDGVREAKMKVYEILWNGTQPFKKLVREMPREVLETADLAVGIPAGVGEKLLHAMKDFTRRVEPAFRDLYNAMEPAVASHAEQAMERVRPHAAMLQARMQELSQNHGERLKARMHELESLMPQITDVLSQIQQIQAALQPYVNEMHDTVRQKVEGAANVARPYVQPVLEIAKEYTKDFKSNPVFAMDDEQ